MPEVHGAAQVRNAKILLILSSIACIIFMGMAAYEDNIGGEWRRHQKAYRDGLAPELKVTFRVNHKQNFLPELKKIDRCVTCHVAVDDPSMSQAKIPLKTHSGDYLKHHPTEKFGCTVCHGGQGRAVNKADAHGHVPHWEEPLLEGKAVFTSCSKCHAENDLYGSESDFYGRPPSEMEIYSDEVSAVLPGAERIARGKQLVTKGGCLGCHTYRGKGGSLGPDITYAGDKTLHSYDYSQLGHDIKHEPRQWLLHHFMNPDEISPGTVMPDMKLNAEDAEALTDYMLSLQRRTLPSSFVPPPPPPTGGVLSGVALYNMYCASCHGSKGSGSNVPEILTPKLNNEDTLAVAGNEYYRYIIAHGRQGTAMPGWNSKGGNLTPNQIGRLVNYIRSFEEKGADHSEVASLEGSAKTGRRIYAGLCSNCHGVRREGGIGPALNAHSFLGMASDEFLQKTIIHGRLETAMPSWKHLLPQDVADLVSYLRSNQRPKKAYTYKDVEALYLPKGKKPSSRIRRIRKSLFRSNCSSCHGKKGEGNIIGPAIANQDFLASASRRFLYEAIVNGRPGTAMPAWRHLEKEDVADLIGYLKSLQKIPDTPPAKARISGDAEYGAVLYKRACVGCHGEQGEGGLGTQLNNAVFLKSASDHFLYQTIAFGRTETAMRGFLKGQGAKGKRQPGSAGGLVDMDPYQIGSLVAHFRSWENKSSGEDLKRNHALTGDVKLGRSIYNEIGGCAKCHGDQGEGASGPSLSNLDFLKTASDGFIIGTTILGRDGTEMRPFHGENANVKLTAKQIVDTTAFIRQWEYKRPPASTFRKVDLTTEAISGGEKAFTSFCIGCHGEQGKGGFAPELNNPQFLSAANDGFLQATIARGRRGTPMRPFGRGAGGIADLDAKTINQIVAYMRSWQKMPASKLKNEKKVEVKPDD